MRARKGYVGEATSRLYQRPVPHANRAIEQYNRHAAAGGAVAAALHLTC